MAGGGPDGGGQTGLPEMEWRLRRLRAAETGTRDASAQASHRTLTTAQARACFHLLSEEQGPARLSVLPEATQQAGGRDGPGTQALTLRFFLNQELFGARRAAFSPQGGWAHGAQGRQKPPTRAEVRAGGQAQWRLSAHRWAPSMHPVICPPHTLVLSFYRRKERRL